MASAKTARKAKAAEKAAQKPNQPRVLVLSGPNLQLLGTREPEIYGRETLADVHKRLVARGKDLGVDLQFTNYRTN